MTDSDLDIVYTLTDEAPALATRSFLPLVQLFAGVMNVIARTINVLFQLQAFRRQFIQPGDNKNKREANDQKNDEQSDQLVRQSEYRE